MSVKDRIRNFERQGTPTETAAAAATTAETRLRSVAPSDVSAAKPKKKKPMSQAFAEFESAGIIIGYVSHVIFCGQLRFLRHLRRSSEQGAS